MSTQKTNVPTERSETILEEAARIVDGPRRKEYGHPKANIGRVAIFWSEIVGVPISPAQVALCMIALKIARLAHKVDRDGVVDICGYARILELLCLGAAEGSGGEDSAQAAEEPPSASPGTNFQGSCLNIPASASAPKEPTPSLRDHTVRSKGLDALHEALKTSQAALRELSLEQRILKQRICQEALKIPPSSTVEDAPEPKPKRKISELIDEAVRDGADEPSPSAWALAHIKQYTLPCPKEQLPKHWVRKKDLRTGEFFPLRANGAMLVGFYEDHPIKLLIDEQGRPCTLIYSGAFSPGPSSLTPKPDSQWIWEWDADKKLFRRDLTATEIDGILAGVFGFDTIGGNGFRIFRVLGYENPYAEEPSREAPQPTPEQETPASPPCSTFPRRETVSSFRGNPVELLIGADDIPYALFCASTVIPCKADDWGHDDVRTGWLRDLSPEEIAAWASESLTFEEVSNHGPGYLEISTSTTIPPEED